MANEGDSGGDLEALREPKLGPHAGFNISPEDLNYINQVPPDALWPATRVGASEKRGT